MFRPTSDRVSTPSVAGSAKMRVLDDEHRGVGSIRSSRSQQLGTRSATVLLLQLCHFWAGDVVVEHDTEQ